MNPSFASSSKADDKPMQQFYNYTFQALQSQNQTLITNNPITPQNYPTEEVIAAWQNPNGITNRMKYELQNRDINNASFAIKGGEFQEGNSVGGGNRGVGFAPHYSLQLLDNSFGEGTSREGENQRQMSEMEMRVETKAEKRHKRMIKNRESAARSRARKQAYTAQLEIEIQELQMENAWLEKRRKVIEEIDATEHLQIRHKRTCSSAF